MATAFFGSNFFGGEFFSASASAPAVAVGGVEVGRRRKRKVIIGDRLYEVDSLRDVDQLLDRITRKAEPEQLEQITKAAPQRIRIVDRINTALDPVEPLPVVVAREIDWTPLYRQLAAQEQAYAEALRRALKRRQDEDDDDVAILLMWI